MAESLSDQLEDTPESKLWAEEETQKQRDQIEIEVKDTQVLVSEKQPFYSIIKEYSEEASPEFLTKAKELGERFSHIRRVRGDGNCFYRAVLFAQLESMLQDRDELKRFCKLSKKWRPRLIKLEFPQFVVNDFCDHFDQLCDEMLSGKQNLETLTSDFNDDEMSNYYVYFIRLVTSRYLQENADYFQGFITDQRSVKEFCLAEVDPMFRECDHVCISALTKALATSTNIYIWWRTGARFINTYQVSDMVKTMVKRLANANRSPDRFGNNDDDVDGEESEPNTSDPRHRSASRESIQSNRTDNGNDAVMRMIAMMEQRDRDTREDNARRDREARDDRRRQEERMDEMMRMLHGRNGPQITVNVRPPRPFYGNEDKDTLDFDDWLITVDSYVQVSGGSWMRKPWSSIPNVKCEFNRVSDQKRLSSKVWINQEAKGSVQEPAPTQEQEGVNEGNGMYIRPL